MKVCAFCNIKLHRHQYVYCSNKCQKDKEYREYILQWKTGQHSGLIGKSTETFSGYIKRYLFKKYNNQCSSCGWNRVNPKGMLPALEVEHIDGNSRNNSEENLTLLCPNCHSLTPFYKNFNKGKGREWRKKKYIRN